MTAVDHAELKRLAEGANPYWQAVDLVCGGNPIAADLVAPFVGSISPAVVLALLSEIEGLKAERAEAKPWQNRKDEWSEAISAAHPVNSDLPWADKCFETAMEMVGNRHGKYELVALVSWLLSDLQSLSTQAPDSWRPIETAPKDGTWVLLYNADEDERASMGFWGSYGTWDDGDFYNDLGDFTHWMPMPLRPQEVTKTPATKDE